MNQSTFAFITRQLPADIRRFLHKKQFVAMLGILIAITLMISFLLKPTDVTAQRLHDSKKQVVSIQINKGDTLWSIAGRYITDDYKDMNSYIREIKETNRLYSDTIHEGGYIVVPYYAQGE
ncbi:LysM peptidoglycan-binding domain-containing protein [Anaerocolumna xylanovorans]|uniref:LysM domain-containing protein n=1 Tax=Anaerocolumna xylanovorans DSM 12503 TaxID=1121345 RepID=A0A1M7Y1M2_9FIRM|nr:LysM peptidoglycan-binding domain-containing protein [Anaerocolumna xylanovorans]SHO45714.1 LysM domain-containing protein [Anaerocolumna xylanovorans DSM 12503]